MASEIEEQFFKTFDIPKQFSMYVNFGDFDCNFQTVTEKSLKKLWDNYGFELGNSAYWLDDDIEKIPESFKEFKKSDFYREEYPEITTEILLELICITNRNADVEEDLILPKYTNRLKECVLKTLMIRVLDREGKIKKEVRDLFDKISKA